MPGIVGLIGRKPREEAEGELRQMIACLRHEDFYVTGTWTDESLGIYIGWAARKGSFSDGMPLRNERGDVVLAFAGEEFPEPATVRRLTELGHDVAVDGPAYLVHLYEEDAAFPVGLNGRFHGLVADLRRGSATLFNDRYGMERLYYHEAKDAFYFAAEAKAILAVRPELRKLDPRGLGEFIACGAVLENRSLFEGIAVLPPASAWTFRGGSLEKKSGYFDPKEWEDQEPLDAESFYRELREAFTHNLPRYFGGRERVAMSLTGGLDTRMIMAWQRAEPGNLPCYTFGSMLRENHDVRVARRVAQACKQPFEVIPAGQEFLSRFPYYAERAVYLTDGCIDVNRSPDLYLNEKARQIAPVRMTGDYGGEVLRGVGRLKPVSPSPALFHQEFLSFIRQAGDTHAELVRGHPISFTVFKQAPWDYRGVVALEQTQLSLRSPFLDNNLVRQVFRAPAQAIADSEDCLRLIADGKKELLRIPTDRGLAGNKGRLLSAASRSFLEFQFKAEYAYDMGMPQWVAKADHVFSGFHLERLFLGRHKVFHFRTWYRGALAGYVREMLLDPRSVGRPYVDRKGLEAVVGSHLKGDRNYTTEIHKLLSLELIHRVFLDSN
jgi:asparagine synthase (glutamine-hydrolysing)